MNKEVYQSETKKECDFILNHFLNKGYKNISVFNSDMISDIEIDHEEKTIFISNLIFSPYIPMNTQSIISISKFKPKKSIASRYSTGIINNNYSTVKINKNRNDRIYIKVKHFIRQLKLNKINN